MFIKKIIPFLVVIFLTAFSVTAQNVLNIIPAPAKAEKIPGEFLINTNTKIILEGSGTENSAAFFNDYLQKYYGFQLSVSKQQTTNKNVIILNFDKIENTIPGAYNMHINNDAVYIGGDNEAGVFYGIQSLIQLLPATKSSSLKIPQCTIIDSPRFAYRGLHLDCSRHFFSVDFVKKYIDFIAMSKMNTFHWHLTDDQGWRIEIKKYPLLTQKGACRNGTIIGNYPGKGNDDKEYCGYYTQEQIKDIVKYAAARYVTIIPEIEMPGHASAAIAAYPQLSCFPDEPTNINKIPWGGKVNGKEVQQTWGVFEDVFCPSDYTFNFLENVLDEVMELFPSAYIHIGGDECPKDSWKRSAFCQNLMKEKGIKNEEGLQSYFIHTIEKYINSKGRQIIGWDEILEGGLAPNATVMSWRGLEGGIAAAKLNHQVIMTPGDFCYFDHAQSKHDDSLTIGGYLPVETVYSYDPLPNKLNADEQKYILGAQANLWTEYIANDAKAEYMLLPRLAALSEVLWSAPVNKNWSNFQTRLQSQYQRYDLWMVHFNTKGIQKGE
ncbi:MAG: beta-N-acetylhexosaminidase [Chitinophagaceae bacterium]